ncbi:hypothetical protein [Botrimarina mediterranea]|uniref:Uncharacterized protein n=1 Tax=Botrimarina mediterranea TaxID=2528022 RepID=A0A518KCM2_9BACT|nr:hypothetical protein [Botrimarina mediterranea]QDV75537.1 hypothetical protein Spa11_37550 [Botrimarina mediterranea]QDV80171.1 hypothetical protein K2D_37950 [Planctomycetes bacterium K2D]
MPTPPTTPPEEDDDFEYEVEPADEEVIAGQARRAREELKRAEQAIDVDSIYREMNRRDDFDAAFESIKGRLSIRHLLIATTVVAVLLGLGAMGFFNGATFAAFICLSLVVLGSLHAWLGYQESKRRAELVALREAQLRQARRVSGVEGDNIEDDEDDIPIPSRSMPSPAEVLREYFRFGLGEFLLAAAVATVVIALLAFTESPLKGAAALGAVAITGLALQAAEIDVPRPLVLAFWLSLVGFCLLTVVSFVL